MLHPQDSRFQRARPKGRKSKWTPNSVAYKVDQLARSLGGKRGSARHKAVVAAAIGDQYAASNARVSRRIGIDLGALGYPVTS
ncbi:hypothetical protein P2H44_08790 [Albimonas sp. CAU 1670]|uniref:hypothetical protein n=1 Tax=Albimonas sp. CAU 1670 TaxID=3032599 RepID=UPI0023DA3F75|nr:hypothetical protein [Albimonas sp. CAU 1670]MDF2232647.1 hypothetical protein [Albimonas sp. CAU 1670]